MNLYLSSGVKKVTINEEDEEIKIDEVQFDFMFYRLLAALLYPKTATVMGSSDPDYPSKIDLDIYVFDRCPVYWDQSSQSIVVQPASPTDAHPVYFSKAFFEVMLKDDDTQTTVYIDKSYRVRFE